MSNNVGTGTEGATSPPTDNLYTAQKRDGYISLYFMGARYYDQQLGRFISPDTIVPNPRNPQSLNRYSYSFNNPLKYTDPTGHDPLDPDWENAFSQSHGGNAPTDTDRIDRLNSIMLSNSGAWGDADWQGYTQAKQSGSLDPIAVLKGTSGSLDQRIKLASALVTLATSGQFGNQLYQSFIGGGGSVQYGGGPFRQGGTAIGWNGVVYLDEGWQGWRSEMTASFIAHESYHAQQSIARYPYTRGEEVQAFTREAKAWQDLRASYTGPRDANWQRREDILSASQSPGGLKAFVDADPFYNQWFFRP